MSLYKQPGSDIYWTRFTIKGRPRVRESTGETDERKAQRVEDTRKAETWKLEPALIGKTWGTAVLKWAEAKSPSNAEIKSIMHFGKHMTDCKLTDITAVMVDRALKKFCKTPSTYTRHRARVSAILKLSDINIKLEVRKIGKIKERDWLTHEQWDALEHELPDHLHPMAMFAINTGLRQANVLGLTWDKVDLERKLVWTEGIAMKGGKGLAVPLNTGAIHALISVQGQHPEFCFTYQSEPITEINRAWKKANHRAGTGVLVEGKNPVTGKPTSKYTGFTWHGLRHTWATWHVQAGTPLDVLQKLGGWASYSMVLRYARHSPGYLASFADNITKEE